MRSLLRMASLPAGCDRPVQATPKEIQIIMLTALVSDVSTLNEVSPRFKRLGINRSFTQTS